MSNLKNSETKPTEIFNDTLLPEGKKLFSNNPNKLKNPKTSSKPPKERAVFVFDFNACRDDNISKYLLDPKIGKILRENEADTTYIFTTILSLNATLKILNRTLKLKSGYIVCNNGSRIYDIAARKIIYEVLLDKNTRDMITHMGTIQSLLIISSSADKDFCYTQNYLLFDNIRKKFLHPYHLTTNYLTYKNFIKYNQFANFLLYDSDYDEITQKQQYFKALEKQWNIYVTQVTDCIFSVSNAECCNLNAINKILENLNIVSNNNIYYFSLNSFDTRSWFSFCKHRYLNIEYFISNKKFIKQKIDLRNTFIPKNIYQILSDCFTRLPFNTHTIISNRDEYVKLTHKKI